MLPGRRNSFQSALKLLIQKKRFIQITETYMAIRIENGFQYKYEFSFSDDDIIGFAKVSGDHNPIHLDEEYASKTIFKKRIIHGFLGGSVFSKVFGTIVPGEGTIYLSQSLKFMGPMYIGES